jgi:threonine 3-dehydrogenase
VLAPVCEKSPETGIRVNALGTYHMLEAARLFKAQQLIFASSITVITGDGKNTVLDDNATTHPDNIYAAAKLFSENMGLFYRRKYGFDFRSLRFPGIVGPGLRSFGFFNYVSEVIGAAVAGKPYLIGVDPGIRTPILYLGDLVRALTELAATPMEKCPTANYLVLGPKPVPSAGDIVERVKAKIPDAQVGFKSNAVSFDNLPADAFDDRCARKEWGWQPRYDLDGIIDAFIAQKKK